MQNLPKRLLSIDVLRALTMFLMIFVNDASGVKHIPEWIDHANGKADAMGFADVIFPAFLFILGLSLPFAINNRIKKGDSTFSIFFYIVSRSFALIVMGFYQVNLETYNSTAALIPKPVWAILVTGAFFLIWLDYPEEMDKAKKYTLMGIGVGVLVAMAVVYKGGEGLQPMGMRPSWWGILGIIGWSYLVCACVYYACQGRLMWLVIFLAIFAGINIATHTGVFNGKLWLIGDASSVTLSMCGVVISGIFASLFGKGKTKQIWVLLTVAGVLLIVAGLFIRPYADGISKIRSTPAWVFICAGITTLLFELFIYLVDVRGNKDLFKWIRPAGTSTLTCYLLPYFQVFLMQLFHLHWPYMLNNGAGGLSRAMGVSLVLILLVGLMEKKRLRLKI